MTEHEIKFPVEWHYKVICRTGTTDASDQICKVLRCHGYEQIPEPGNTSGGGKFISYRVSITFQDLESMRNLSSAIEALPCVVMLI